MKFHRYSLLSAFAVLVIVTGCKTDDTTPEPDAGNASIIGHVKHHDDIIPYAKVYLKHNAVDFPGENTALYDDSTTADKGAHYTFNHLKQGNYYLYSIGYDSAFAEVVKGGIPVNIDAPGKQVSSNIPVTE